MLKKEEGQRVLVAARLLSRLLPFMFECDHASLALTEFLAPSISSADPTEFQVPLLDGCLATIKSACLGKLYHVGRRLALRSRTDTAFAHRNQDTPILHYLVNNRTPQKHELIFIREHGIGSDVEIDTFQEIDLNRIDVLRLLLVLLSRNFYFPPSKTTALCILVSLHSPKEPWPFVHFCFLWPVSARNRSSLPCSAVF
jgi:hypothetical protein